MQPASLLRRCLSDVFSQIRDTYLPTEDEIDEEHLVALRTFGGEDVERALLSYETAKVTLFADEYDRQIFMVETNPEKYYFVNYHVDACTCHSYRHRVLKGDPESFLCKHVIIVRLADATGNFVNKTIEQPKLSHILASPPEFDKEKNTTVVRVSNSEIVPLKEFLYGKEEVEKEAEEKRSEPPICDSYIQASQVFQDLVLSQATKKTKQET